MIKVILDTNFLIYCAKNKLDYVEEIGKLGSFELVVPSVVVEELRRLKEELALQILEKNINDKKVKVLEARGEADNVIENLAGKSTIIATMDKELKDKIKGKARILSIRQKRKIEIL